MKKVYRYVGYSSIDGGEWDKLGCSEYLIYMDESLCKEFSVIFESFDVAYQYLCKHDLVCAYISSTLFKKRPVINYENTYCLCEKVYKMTKKSFKPFKEKWVFEEVTDHTFKELMCSMKTDNFIEYCKDKDFSCSIITDYLKK